MEKILILGVNGQDGSYLAEIELKKGNQVWGLGRQKNSRWIDQKGNYNYINIELNNIQKLNEILKSIKPDIVYHFAAMHGPSGYRYENAPEETLTINSVTVEIVLEYIRKNDKNIKLVYASSSKVFSKELEKYDENSLKESSCLYSLSKNISQQLIDFYNQEYQMQSSVVWLFNHESIRRPDGYFINKIADLIVDGLKNKLNTKIMGNLNFWCDWGSAEEYMRIISEITRIKEIQNNNYVLATGKTTNAYELVNNLFRFYDLEPKKYIKDYDENLKIGKAPWYVDISKLEKAVKKQPLIGIEDIFKKMIDYKLNSY